MTPLERVLAAAQGKPLIRPPFTMTLSMYGARLIDCPLTEYYRNPERYAEGQEAVAQLCSPDILFAPFALPLEGEAFGSELVFSPQNPPNVSRPAVTNPEELLRRGLPDVDSHPSLVYFREAVRRMTAKLKGQTAICGVLTAPIDLPAIIMGMDMWIETLISAPETARAVLDLTNRYFISMANALFSEGAHFVGLATVFTNPRIVFKTLVDELMLPSLGRAFSQLKGPVVFHHGANPIVPFLKDYLSLPNVGAFVIDHRESLRDARTMLGPGRLLLGNLHGPTLAKLPIATALEKVDHILADRRDDPNYIFATSAADVAWDTPPELLQAISQRIQSFARQPK